MNIDFASELDPEQYRAVTTTEEPLLIIAGAGSGKTRVITFRIARLLSMGVPQESILALTFTNKAAREMAERARQLTGLPLKNLVIATFHSFGAWFLRKEIHRLGWKDNFTIYDEQDRMQAAKECARELGFGMEGFDAAQAASFISATRTGFSPAARAREGGAKEPGGAAPDGDAYKALFEEYRKSLKLYNAVDFDDLIAMPLEIFGAFPESANVLRKRFRYVMIDEFQDTSFQQYELVKAFATDNICAVGDDDQSIYSWRGANFGNLEKFEKDHPGIVEIKLERNYRSTSTILGAANALISHNVKRKKKNLWSPGEKLGVPILFDEIEDETEEAENIVCRMKKMRVADGFAWDAFGILVRTNAQARVIEETLMETGLPYRTAGGPSFYQRKEVRDMLAYLKAAANLDDDMSVLRIINVPRRGIGKVGLEKISGFSRSRNMSMHTALEIIERAQDPLSGVKTVREAMGFFAFLAGFRETLLSRKKPISACLREMVTQIGYWHYLLEEYKTNDKTAAWKYRNIELLAASIERWEKDPDTLDKGLFAYLARVALVTRDDPDDDDGKISLLTIHSAKGLEFDVVFVPGCEEGILPHARSLEDGGGDLEEERRLFYVALTRAKMRLFLSRCLRRKHRMQAVDTSPSPFLAELPVEFVRSEDPVESARSEEELRKDMLAKMKAMFAGKADAEKPENDEKSKKAG
ncbi:MAG TPA: ATP-dependent helicase [Rectinemataceae bacterium]|nr:ATP-dependent helicase [Rectinemataceae bacterium]